jgi:uncharacterized protein (DUF58 family)
MIKFGNIYLSKFFFLLYGGVILLYILAFSFSELNDIGYLSFIILISVSLIDAILILSYKGPLEIKRELQTRMNLGDANKITIRIHNKSLAPIKFTYYEGYPIEMQKRNSSLNGFALPSKEVHFEYSFAPKKRGNYVFRDSSYTVASLLGLWQRRFEIKLEQNVGVYPSILQMKKYELMVFDHQVHQKGIKRIRRIGNNQEFEQIKNYVQGDEIRHINWKATSRRSELMVNQYQEEKSQQVYFLIDKSRPMQMEFENMSMLDYAINSALIISNITLRKGDKTGLITFSDKIGDQIPADKKTGQLKRILESLYQQKTHYKEPNYELLFQTLHRTIKTRSLLMLYTNFETAFSMRRVLPLLRKLNQKHVVVIILFKHKELESLAFGVPKNKMEVYQTVIAEKMLNNKEKIAEELNKYGIQTILTLPNDLNLNVVNKYLEMKAKGTI